MNTGPNQGASNNNAQNQSPATTNANITALKKDISQEVLNKVVQFSQNHEIVLPPNYSPENAIKTAMLIISDPKNNLLVKCTRESVAEALLKAVINGVSPIKKQCYFIPYGDKLSCDISYFGNLMLAKRYGKVKDVRGVAVFKGDEFVFEVNPATATKKIISHKQTLETIGSGEVVGAYALVEFVDGSTNVEVMDINQIKQAWGQGAMKGNSPAHKNFPDQMAIKTVINRACKIIIGSSDDSALYNPLEESAEETESKIEAEIKNNANKQKVDFSDAEEAVIVSDSTSENAKASPEPATQQTPNNAETAASFTPQPDLFKADPVDDGPGF